MATPDPSTQISSQPSPSPLEAPIVPLPPSRLPAAGAGPAQSRGQLWLRRGVDLFLAGVVLAFAFLVASFAVRNSDFWLHLADGRLLAERQYQFGVDPFTYTTDGVYWANHAWLFDLLLYLLYSQFGGTVLVVLKAALIAVLAGLMLSVRRPGSGIGIPAACTLLAVLAMSPRLLLHSTCLSYVLLGLTFWLLWRPLSGPPGFRQEFKRALPLLLVFVLWVNVDAWFLLGPILALLFWLGEQVQAVGDEPPRTPAWLWLAGLAVCLINPHTWHAFTLPVELAPLPAELQHDIRFQRLFVSPWQLGWPYHPVSGINLAASAYFALVGLGLLSFLFNWRNLLGWRLLVWLSFAGLAAWLERAVPFFAVVAGPITALNFQHALRARDRARTGNRVFLARASYFVLTVAGLALIFLTWPGWLQGFQGEGRRVDWTVQPDGTLQRVAQTLHRWYQEKKLGDNDRGFPMHPGVVHYCAWFCPEEKGFLDSRFSLFRGVAGEYEEICRTLNPALDPERGGRSAGGGELYKAYFRDRGITHIILYDPSPALLMPAQSRLTLDPENWSLLHIDGQALLFGWKRGNRMLPAGVPAFDADRLAFAPSGPPEEWMIPPAPEGGPGREPRPADIWSRFENPVPPPSWETGAARALLRYFEDSMPRRGQERGARCAGWAAALVGLPAAPGSLENAGRVLAQLELAPLAPADLYQQPPAVPLLAVRAARRALAVNPDDADAYLALGQAYLMLRALTPERDVVGAFPLLGELRRMQIAVALESALRRNPNLRLAHEILVQLYGQSQFFDAALEHLRAQLRLTRRDGPAPGENAESFSRRLSQLETNTRELERQVVDRRNEFALQSQKLGAEPYRKARMALSMGLPLRALDDILTQSQMVLLGGEGIRLQVELQLLLGRIDVAREQLHREDWKANRQNLGIREIAVAGASGQALPYLLPAYDWLLLCAEAADGGYEQAAAAFQTLFDDLTGTEAAAFVGQIQRLGVRVVAAEVALSSDPNPWLSRRLVATQRLGLGEQLTRMSFLVIEQTDLQVLAGMLSLEQGATQIAEGSFERAIALNRLGTASAQGSAALPLAKAYLQIIRNARR
jgi:hypothetical protein